MLQMGIISEKDIHDHDGNVFVVSAPSPIVVKPKSDDNNAASVINDVVVGSASLQRKIAASRGDDISGTVEDADGSTAPPPPCKMAGAGRASILRQPRRQSPLPRRPRQRSQCWHRSSRRTCRPWDRSSIPSPEKSARLQRRQRREAGEVGKL